VDAFAAARVKLPRPPSPGVAVNDPTRHFQRAAFRHFFLCSVMVLSNKIRVIGRENNVVIVDFSREPDPPAPRFPEANALRKASQQGALRLASPGRE